METSLVVACLCLLLLPFGESRYRPKSRNSCRGSNNCYKYPRPAGLTCDGRACPITDGCIKLPDKKDMMTREQFEEHIVGKTGYVIYRIEHIPIDEVTQQECTFSVEGNQVFVSLRFRLDTGQCFYLDTQLGEYSCDKRAIVTASDIQYLGVEELQNPLYYFFSDNPSEYYLLFTCTQRSTIRNGCCEGWYYVDVVLTQDPPNNPPYGKIEEELCRKLGVRMDDPLNKFLYRGEACPDP